MSENIYLIMNKPCGYVCSAVSDSHKTVYELLTPELCKLVQGAKRGHRLHTVGRLDCETGGMLLFTTDGLFSHKITSKTETGRISKVYRVKLAAPVSPDNQNDYIKQATQGLILPPEKKYGEQKSEPAVLNFITNDLCEITISEGKFHEVRRIFRALGNEVSELYRISIGKLKLPDDLYPGAYRSLSKEEIILIFS